MHLRAGMHGYGPRPNIYGRWGHRYKAQGVRPPCKNRKITEVLGLRVSIRSMYGIRVEFLQGSRIFGHTDPLPRAATWESLRSRKPAARARAAHA